MKKNMDSNCFMDFGNACKMDNKKIVIQSDAFDVSTDDVISWLYYLEPEVELHKLFDTTKVEDIEIRLSNKASTIKINNKEVFQNEPYWYRRGQLSFNSIKNNNEKDSIEKKIAKEYIEPIEHYIASINYPRGINKFDDNHIRKLSILNDCIELGIKVPNTLVTSSFDSLKEFLKRHEKIICKPAKNPFTRAEKNNIKVKFSAPTILITHENIDRYPKKFLTSLFQSYIPKKIELRSFYLKGQFYTMAIFSQNNPKTIVDFRNYDRQKPNRIVPYKLPDELKTKLVKLMQLNRLDCGSFDIILTPDNEYIFLEVNPIGQFQWLSRNCNYFLEKIIAEYLLGRSVN